MMIYIYFTLSILLSAAQFAVRSRRMLRLLSLLFYGVQILLPVMVFTTGLYETTSGAFFTFDALGMLFLALLIVVSAFVWIHSDNYLTEEELRKKRSYFGLLQLLTVAIAGVYLANNVAVTWIFLETTTLCAAGIIYHWRTPKALEAAWKYLFVCSTGIAMAYLGVLLLGTAAQNGSLNYTELAEAVKMGNPLYLKIAFLLILCGYSCKMELFPLHTVGIDANYSAPTPAAALISTGLVNAGFLAIFRIYMLLSETEIFSWVRGVMMVAGLLSLAVGALFLRRTNDYRRFLSYSTVENMGIVAIGLGIGGVGVWAALFHLIFHTLIKSGLFLQVALAGKLYRSYRINRIGSYLALNRVGGITILAGMVALLAFPPSPLFISELRILQVLFADGSWWLAAGMIALICIAIYSIASRLLRLCYQPNQEPLHDTTADVRLSWSALSLLIAALIAGLWLPEPLVNLLNEISAF